MGQERTGGLTTSETQCNLLHERDEGTEGLNSVLEKVPVFLFLPPIFFYGISPTTGIQACHWFLCCLWTDKRSLWSLTWQRQRDFGPLLTFLIYSSTEVPPYEWKFRIKTLISLQLECNGTYAPKENYYIVGKWETYFSLTVYKLFSLPNDAEWCIKKLLDVYLTII